MRSKRRCRNGRTDDPQEWLKKFDEAIVQNSELLRKDGRVITRIRFALEGLKKAAKLRRKVKEPDGKVANPGTKKNPSPARVSIAPPELLTEQLLAVRNNFAAVRNVNWVPVQHTKKRYRTFSTKTAATRCNAQKLMVVESRSITNQPFSLAGAWATFGGGVRQGAENFVMPRTSHHALDE